MRGPRSSDGAPAAPRRLLARVGEGAREGLRRWRAAAAVGLPPASPREQRLGSWVAAAATVWMLLVAAWGINGPFGDGHFAASAAMGIAGDNMWRLKIPYPIHTYVDAVGGGNIYMHHPLGVYWVDALLIELLGHHNWVLRLPAVCYSTLSTLLLYRFGRAAWGPLAGAVASLAFASLPITLGFSSFHALEGPVIFGMILTAWGYARFTQTWRGGYAAASIAGLFWAVTHDWAGYVFAALFLGWVFLRGFLLPERAFGATASRALGRYWGLALAVVLASLALFVALLISTDRIRDLLSMYAVRSSGNAAPLSAVLKARHVWIQMMFPGLAIALGKLALPVVLARFAIRRADVELVALLVLATATYQYLHFKQGADVHIFWPQYYALYFALGMGALAASVAAALRWLGPRLPRAHPPWLGREAALVGAGAVALPLLFVLRDGASMIRLAQESGGRFVSPQIKSDIDRVAAMRWWLPRLPKGEKIAFHPGITPVHWGLGWEMRPHALLPNQRLSTPGAAPYAMDSRFAEPAELREAARQFHVEAVGNFWFIDRRAPAAPLDGYSFDEREPGPISWYLDGGTEPLRRVRPDPWVTWEWRTLLDQPTPIPIGEPTTAEQQRIAYNLAVVAGNVPDQTRWLEALRSRFAPGAAAVFDDGTELLGVVRGRGAEHFVTLYFRAGPRRGNAMHARFQISAQVVKGPRLSTLPLDPETITIDTPPPIPTELWRPGHIYAIKATYRHRPGTERLFGAFVPLHGGPVPRPASGAPVVEIVTL